MFIRLMRFEFLECELSEDIHYNSYLNARYSILNINEIKLLTSFQIILLISIYCLI